MYQLIITIYKYIQNLPTLQGNIFYILQHFYKVPNHDYVESNNHCIDFLIPSLLTIHLLAYLVLPDCLLMSDV